VIFKTCGRKADEEHLPALILGILRLRAQAASFVINPRGVALKDDGGEEGLKDICLDQ